MHITKRISSICSYLEGSKLADIGTDHCFLPIFAIKSGKVDSAIGVDVASQPLHRAYENVSHEGLWDKIELRLGNGLTPIAPGECDTAVISGMGGALISTIIENGLHVARGLSQLILSPQSDPALVRRSLHKFGFEIYNEDMVADGAKFYPLILARPCEKYETQGYSDFDYEFGKIMLAKPNCDFLDFLRELHRKNENIINNNPLTETRKAEVLEVNGFVREFLNSI